MTPSCCVGSTSSFHAASAQHLTCCYWHLAAFLWPASLTSMLLWTPAPKLGAVPPQSLAAALFHCFGMLLSGSACTPSLLDCLGWWATAASVRTPLAPRSCPSCCSFFIRTFPATFCVPGARSGLLRITCPLSPWVCGAFLASSSHFSPGRRSTWCYTWSSLWVHILARGSKASSVVLCLTGPTSGSKWNTWRYNDSSVVDGLYCGSLYSCALKPSHHYACSQIAPPSEYLPLHASMWPSRSCARLWAWPRCLVQQAQPAPDAHLGVCHVCSNVAALGREHWTDAAPNTAAPRMMWLSDVGCHALSRCFSARFSVVLPGLTSDDPNYLQTEPLRARLSEYIYDVNINK